MWLSETESQLKNDELGKDLLAVKNLQQKHNLLESDVHVHQVFISLRSRKVNRFYVDLTLFEYVQFFSIGNSVA